jgi:actin-related protein 7
MVSLMIQTLNARRRRSRAARRRERRDARRPSREHRRRAPRDALGARAAHGDGVWRRASTADARRATRDRRRRAMASDAPVTVLDVVDGDLRGGYALDGVARAPSATRRGRVRAKSAGRGNGSDDGAFDAIARSRVEDVDAYECVVRAMTYGDLGWERGSEGMVVACEASGTSNRTRERTARMFFEEFNVGGLAFLDKAVCAMYACGRASGVAIDVGEQGVECACVVEGATAHSTTRRNDDAGGRAMDRALVEAVRKKQGIALDLTTASDIRRKLGKCAATREEYEALARGCATVECEQETFAMPDGSALKLTNELYECGEAVMPIVDDVCECVQKCSSELRRFVLDSVFVHGVASKVSGLDARLFHELTSSLPPSLTPTMVNIPEYMPETTWSHAPWTGAAMAAKTIFASNQYISKSDYTDNGPPIAHRGR